MSEVMRCERTGKVCYPSEGFANGVIRRLKKRRVKSKNVPKRAYRCEHCGYWHLTHFTAKCTRRFSRTNFKNRW
jgi:uncharacterized Zn finger protein